MDAVQRKFDELAPGYSAKYAKPKDILAFEKQRRMDLLVEHAVSLKPATVLDAGCGSGVVLSKLHDRLPDAALHGVDLSFNMLREAKGDSPPGTWFAQSAVEKLPFADNSIDLVYALGVIDYLENPERFFRAVRNILTPGGYFIFTYPNGHSINRNFRLWLRARLSRSGSDVTAKPLKTAAIEGLVAGVPGEILQRHFITYGNGMLSFPWSVAVSRAMERWNKNRVISRYLAWTCLCVMRKAE